MSFTRTALLWLALLGALFAGFSLLVSRWENPNTQVQTVVEADGGLAVVLKRNRGGHFVATGTINGHRVTFLVDTGASRVAVPQPLANELGLVQGRALRLQTAAGVIRGYTTVLDEVTLGGLRMRNVRGVILPERAGREVLLGMSFLKHLEVIQRGDTMILRVPGSLRDTRSP